MSRWMIAVGLLVFALAAPARARLLVFAHLALALRRRRRLLGLCARDLRPAHRHGDGQAAAEVLVDGAARGELREALVTRVAGGIDAIAVHRREVPAPVEYRAHLEHRRDPVADLGLAVDAVHGRALEER